MVDCIQHRITIDHETNTLYAICVKCFGVFDLEKEEWKKTIGIADKYDISNVCEISNVMYLPSPVQQLHILGVSSIYCGIDTHFKFDAEAQTFIEFENIIDIEFGAFENVYLSSKHKVMLFAIRGIYECDMLSNQSKYDWNKLDIELPAGLYFSYKPLIPVSDVEIIFFFEQTTIYCLDLTFNDWVEYKDRKLEFGCFPQFSSPCLAGEYIHFLDTFEVVYFKIKLIDILQKNERKHIERDELIVFGYIASIKDALNSAFPYDLISVVILFFSIIAPFSS